MNDQELSRVEEELRAIMLENRLGWVLSQLDTSISHGITEERPLDEQESIESLAVSIRPALPAKARRTGRSGRSQIGTTNRPQTVRERVLNLLSALKRVAIELPIIEQHTLEQLVDTSLDKRAAVRDIRFLPDEDMTDTETVLKRDGNEGGQRRLALGRLLTQLEEQVRS